MSDSDDYEIGALLGAPVRAIQQAQIEAESEYVRFMLEYGMEDEIVKGEQGEEIQQMKLREFEFAMTRSLPDPVNPGQVVDHQSKVRAPLLSLVQMPAVGIEEANIDLSLNVEFDREQTEKLAARSSGASTDSRARFFPDKSIQSPVLKGTIGNSAINSKFRTQGTLDVSIKLRATHNDDLHGRLARLIGEGLSTGIDVPETD